MHSIPQLFAIGNMPSGTLVGTLVRPFVRDGWPLRNVDHRHVNAPDEDIGRPLAEVTLGLGRAAHHEHRRLFGRLGQPGLRPPADVHPHAFLREANRDALPDAVAPAREDSHEATHRIVSTLLVNLDGLEDVNDVVVVAAGSGVRMGGVEKGLIPIAGRPALSWSLDAFAADPRVRAIFNNRNYGQMRSPTYGIYQANGAAVIGMCADFQDPPAMIPVFVAQWRAGAQIVLAQRRSEHTSLLLGLARKHGYRFLARFGDTPVVPGATGFGLYDSEAAAAAAASSSR